MPFVKPVVKLDVGIKDFLQVERQIFHSVFQFADFINISAIMMIQRNRSRLFLISNDWSSGSAVAFVPPRAVAVVVFSH